MASRYQEFLSRNLTFSQRIQQEGTHHHQSVQQQLERFPAHMFEPGAEFHDARLWDEYRQWVDYIACTRSMDYQTHWRFDDWQRRWRQRLRQARWRSFDPAGEAREQESPFKNHFVGVHAVYRFYRVLGLSPAATNDQIKAAYRELAGRHHPDREGGDTEQMQLVNEAYEQLRRLRGF